MNNATILIVDDEVKIITSIARILMDENCRILGATSGEEALEKMKKNEVDLVISDQKMPGMNGIEFLKKVQVDYPDTLTIMLTAFAEIDTAIKAINEAGVYKFILKPWNEADLIITIKRALESRRLVMEKELLQHQVKIRDALLRDLERKHPGITRVDRDEDGKVLVNL